MKALPRIHVLTDDAVLGRPDLADAVQEVARAGGSDLALHLRGPGTSGRRLHALALAWAEALAPTGAGLWVNDRLDVARLVGARGAHLGRRSIPVQAARGVVGPDVRLGVSTHATAEVVEAGTSGADYVFVGTIHGTPSHPGRPGRGAEAIRAAARAAPELPLVAVGGIGPADVPELRAAGAWGVAVIRGVWDADEPAEAVRAYLENLGVSSGSRPGEGE